MSAPRCSVEEGRLAIDWPDRRIALEGSDLRRRCRCAECRSLQLRGHEPVWDGVSLQGAVAMGYGVQLRFSDGHERGIFPWGYLVEIAAVV